MTLFTLRATARLDAPTFSSCEGHFGKTDPGNFADHEMAEVRFEINHGVSEDKLEKLFGWVLSAHLESPLKWEAILSATKNYIPDEDPTRAPEYTFAFAIRKRAPSHLMMLCMARLLSTTASWMI